MWRVAVLVAAVVSIVRADYPCRVVDGEHVYDLSELAARDYWEFVETLHTGVFEHRKLYISLCHPIRNSSVPCEGNDVGVCETKLPDGDSEKEVALGSRGKPSAKGPTVTQDGWLTYQFENGAKCNKSSRDTTYTTYIHFVCSRSAGLSRPQLMSSPGCELNFAWMTKAACPKKVVSQNATTCLIKFSNSDETLNLHTLHSLSFYNVSSVGGQYELNVCGPITGGRCGDVTASACDVTDPGAPVVLGTTADMTLEWKDANATLDLVYKHGSRSAIVKLVCDRTAADPHVYFVEKNDTHVMFGVRTAVVCTPAPPVCVVEDDKGNVYDLRPLHKQQGNWEVIDGRPDYKDQLYHINVCGEVNDGQSYLCPPGPIGACMASFDARTAYNLGYLTSHPTVNKDGSLTIVYTGGDTCKNGQHSRSTRINLICDQSNHQPVLVKETDTCEYVFLWLTPAACPRHLVEGQGCMVKDPLYGYTYDLTRLRNKNKDYKASDGEHDYLLNACGPLVSPCQGSTQAGMCQVKGDQQYSGGETNSNVTFNDGGLIMTYDNGAGQCNGNHTRKTQIMFTCDHELSGLDGPTFLYEDESCVYTFSWATQHACPPFTVVECSVITKDGLIYDLNELSDSVMNSEYFTPDHKKKFVLNVCRSVVHGKESRCPYSASACLVDLEHHDTALNIGEVRSGPYLEDGVLKIRYTGGEKCSNSSKPSETIIEFKCDKDSLFPYPQLIAQEDCKFIFEWKTAHACPTHTSVAPTINGNCTAKNKYTGHVFDFNSLKKKSGYEISGDGDLHLVLNVCDEVDANKCPESGSGACTYRHDDHAAVMSAGHANANLVYSSEYRYMALTYEGGDLCKDSGKKRATEILFVCGPEGSQEGPVLISDEDCTYTIHWYTELMCERRISCFVDTWDHGRLDLTPLIRLTDNYELTNPADPKEKFYINVCRSLNPVPGLTCQPNAGACVSREGSTDLSLGLPLTTPQYGFEDGIMMMYSHGAVCPSMPGLLITSRITFKCDRSAGQGYPTFLNVTHDCQYQFEWLTSLACEDQEETPAFGSACQIQYEAAKTNVDLQPLSKPGGYSVHFDDKEFKINVCGPACDQSGVCTTSGLSYGLSNQSELEWDYDMLKLTYYSGDECSTALSGHRTTSIYFECDMTAGFGKPVVDPIMGEIECKAVFKWKTNVTCIEGIYKDSSGEVSVVTTPAPASTPAPTPSTGNLPPSSDQQKGSTEPAHSSVSVIISSILVVSGLVFVLVLLLMKSERGQQVVAATRRLFAFKGSSTLLLDDMM